MNILDCVDGGLLRGAVDAFVCGGGDAGNCGVCLHEGGRRKRNFDFALAQLRQSRLPFPSSQGVTVPLIILQVLVQRTVPVLEEVEE